MAPAVLERVAATTTSEAAYQTAEVARDIITSLPWSATLPADDFLEMLAELREAAIAWQRTGDQSPFQTLVDEWQATAEAYSNAGLMAQLARTDRTYVVWDEASPPS